MMKSAFAQSVVSDTRKNMNRWEGKVAFVTGASAGIGATVAEELVKAGVVVVALARRLNRLEELSANLEGARGKLYPRQCDITKEEQLLKAFEWANAELGGIDILVNNAGAGSISSILDGDVESYRKIIDLNVLATAVCIREAVASMKRRDVPGHIVNINSVCGHYMLPVTIPTSVYGASKFAVTSLTEIVRKELADDPNNKIKMTSVSPGAVRTEFAEAAGYTGNPTALEQFPLLDPKDIADTVLHVLAARDRVQVTEVIVRPVGELY